MIWMMLAAVAMAPQSSAYDACLATGEAGNGIQSAMQACADREYERRDARLNQAYKMRMASLPAARRAALRTSERQWIADRNRRCQPSSGGGSLARFTQVDCLAKEAARRTAWLERYR